MSETTLPDGHDVLDGDGVVHMLPRTAPAAAKRLANEQLLAVLDEIAAERVRQDAKWGEQNHTDGTGPEWPVVAAGAFTEGDACDLARRNCQGAAGHGFVTWHHILGEEYHEAMAEEDPVKLRAELVQVAAVAAQWIEAIDRRTRATTSGQPPQPVQQPSTKTLAADAEHNTMDSEADEIFEQECLDAARAYIKDNPAISGTDPQSAAPDIASHPPFRRAVASARAAGHEDERARIVADLRAGFSRNSDAWEIAGMIEKGEI